MSTSRGSSRLSVPVSALVGVLAVAAALGVGHLIAGLLTPAASPFLAVGNGAIDLTPTWLKNFAVRSFGSNDKFVLLIGMGVVIALAGVVAGLASRRSRLPGLALVVLLGVVGIGAVLVRPDAAPLDALAAVGALAAGAGVFVLLHRLAMARQAAGPGTDSDAGAKAGDVSRRRLLVSSAAVAAGAGVAGAAGQFLAGRVDVEASRAALGRIVPDVPAPAVPAGADFAADGSPSFITPNSDFYRVDVNLTLPQLRAQDWRLRIHGMVERELTIDWAELTSRKLVELPLTMTCVSNEVGGPYLSTANFTGVMLADLLKEAGVRPGADQVFTTSVDGWTCGSPTEAILDPRRQAMLVIAMNREPLPVEHGFPVRMVVPGLYGFVSGTKWITDMELTTFGAKQAYWLQRDWGRRAPIKTMSRIDYPGSFERMPGDRPITGVAWAQTKGIQQVQVRVDGGEWRVAELSTEVSKDTWRMWRLPGRLAPGLHTAEVRATDRTGYTQTDQRAMPIPDGATGWHSVQFTVQ